MLRGVGKQLWLGVWLTVFLPAAAYAQASIGGMVRDTSGAVLPGVTVEAASPALIEKVRSAVTDGTGLTQITDTPHWFEETPDWCISRQRAWGVPITVFVDKKSGEPLRDEKVLARIIEAIAAEGADAWFASDPARFLAPDHDPADFEQVRDILDIADCVEAYVQAWRRMDSVRGQAFNLGGGPANAVSLKSLIQVIEAETGGPATLDFADWRAGDQKWFVADARRAQRALGLAKPRLWREGVAALIAW